MPRKTRRPPPYVLTTHTKRPSRVPRWLGYLLTALLAAAVGAGGTYLTLRPALKRAAAITAPTPSVSQNPGSSPATTAPGIPPPALTVGLDPAHAALNLGNWYEDAGDWTHAIANYLLAIADGLDNPNIRTDLGVAYYKSGQAQKALEQYQHAQSQDRHHETSLFNQGSALASLGRNSEAIAVWQSYLRRFPHGHYVTGARQLIAEVKAHGLPPSVNNLPSSQ